MVDILSKAYIIHINGIVQGVGFRPFVYNIAQELKVKGWVKNSSDGVDIHVEGEKIDVFFQRLINEKPPLASIFSVDKKEIPINNYTNFNILESEKTQKNDVNISPDVATCNDCLHEMFNKADRRYHYPFINCTNCGPRYSIIIDRPYDRDKTTMKDFTMCSKCKEEYENPRDRRFHAQPVACDDCGPILRLLDNKGQEINNHGIGIDLLEQGAIIAVKGLGGFHLVCDAYNNQAVKKLRAVKERGLKPFALMARNFETIANEVRVTEFEYNILKSPSAPIVLLPRRNDIRSRIAPEVAPKLHTLGIMLPYTPVHYLLFQGCYDFLVMTSANLSGRPLIYENDDALNNLYGIADYFLLHNRDIYHPCDDSVIQVIGGKTTFHRRARGYVPFPMLFQDQFMKPIAGLGGEMKNAFCLAGGNKSFMSQYIGDMHGFENFERFKQEYSSYQKLVNIFPEAIAFDLHPDYATTKMAKKMNGSKVSIQHHHAHHVSVMGEYGLEEPLLGLICDGTGYGEDGKTWGFEYIYGNAEGYQRKGHLEYLPLPGGDAGAKHPLRIAYAYIKKIFSNEEWVRTEPIWNGLTQQEKTILDSQLKNNFQIFETSSAGRIFDAISGILGICTEVTYEGQAAIELESIATLWSEEKNSDIKNNIEKFASNSLYKTIELLRDIAKTCDRNEETRYKAIEKYNQFKRHDQLMDKELYQIWTEVKNGMVALKVDFLLADIVNQYLQKRDIGEIAYCFHYSLALAMLEVALLIGLKDNKLIIGGGVFQNKLLTETLLSLAQKVDVTILYPTKLPSGDGGLAFGQVLIANKNIKSNKS